MTKDLMPRENLKLQFKMPLVEGLILRAASRDAAVDADILSSPPQT